MPINVSPTTGNDSTHHIKLTDASSTSLGLICTDSQGDRIPRVTVSPYPTFASQLRQGRGNHADRVPPFTDIVLSDFSGGLGMLHHDEDASMYLDGKRANTTKENRVLCGGEEVYTTGIRDMNTNWSTDVTHAFRISAVIPDASISFVASASYNVAKVIIPLQANGGAGDITVTLRESDETVLKTKALTGGTDCLTDVVWENVEFEFDSVQAITSGTTYKINIDVAGTYGSSTNILYTLKDAESGGDYLYRVLDDTADFNIIPFEYRGGFYCVTQPKARSVSSIYQLGTRALADSNSGHLDRLVDADKNFSSAGYTVAAGDLVKIIAGPGSEEDQPWRTVTAGYDNYIEVSPDWITEHTVNTEYVVITDEWELVDTLDYYCTDVAVTDRVIHLAGGGVHHRARFGNDDGTWTFQGDIGTNEIEDAINSDKLLAVRHDSYHATRPVFDLYSSQLQTHSNTDLIEPCSIKKLETPPYWGEPYYKIGQLVDTDAWVNQTFDDTNTDIYSNKGNCSIEWNATFTTGDIARINVPMDMSGGELILFSMKSDTALDAGDLVLKLEDTADNNVSYNFPAITTGDDMHDDFYWYEIPLHALDTAPTVSHIMLNSMKKFVINVAKDKNAVVKLKLGEMILATRNPNNERYELGLTERVNNMVEYGGGAGQVTRKPWVGTNKNVYYIEDGNLKPIYLKEIEELEHYRNCEGMCVNDVYLYFNQEEKIQSYYSGQLKNVGPDVNYGLPENRRGIPCSMASYPGTVFVAIDGGADNYSSIIARRGHGWHEIYRAPNTGDRIRSIYTVGRDDTTDRMYFSEGADIGYIPISLNPELDSDYRYAHESTVETSRIYGGLRETEKYFESVDLVGDNLPTNTEIEIDYMLDDQTTWNTTAISMKTGTGGTGTLLTTGKWIRLRFRLLTEDATSTPILTGAVLNMLERLTINNTYHYTVGLKEGYDVDLRGTIEDETGVEKLTQLETWVDDPGALTLNTASGFENGKTVFIEGLTKRVRYHKVDNKEQETRLVDITLIEAV